MAVAIAALMNSLSSAPASVEEAILKLDTTGGGQLTLIMDDLFRSLGKQKHMLGGGG